MIEAADADQRKQELDARRWKKELQLAKKRERDWTNDADKIIKRYRGEEKKRNRFNVLWSNTEILRPAIYNSKPNPDVRRRFRDADLVGKAVSEVLERSLSVFVDGDETDDSIKNDVLDALLVGRGVSRIRYVPKIATQLAKSADDPGEGSDSEDDGAPPVSDVAKPENLDAVEPDEVLESEWVCLEHVDWRDFRHGYGRVWPEVPWVAYRHKLSRPDAEEKFGQKAVESIKFAPPTSDDPNKPDQDLGETQKVAEFWEIWDKLGERVFFLHDDLQVLLFPLANPEGEPPLDLDGFFPSPRPLSIVENTASLLPIPLFNLYEDQANELDKLSGRINKIVNSLRLRGAYDSRMTEISDILASDDNDMIPVQNAQQWLDGGLDKAFAWVPVEKNAEVLQALYDARDRQKAIIDELLGISDIIRGATDPNETATAQQIKSNYGSVRLQRMQKEVARYARDLFRLAAAAMGEKFSPETFERMTELKFPTAQQKASMIAMFQHQQAMAQQAQLPNAPGMPPGAPPGAPSPAPMDPAMLQMPTWEDILGVMRSEKMQQYKIDVETDSTIAATLSSDMQGLSQVLTSVSQTMQELAPMVTQGVLPVDSAKQLIMAVIRRARLGSVVEDAFDKMQAPKPPPDPNAGEAQAAIQQTQAKAQADIQVAKIKADLDAHVAQVQQQAQAQQNREEQILEEQRSLRKQDFEMMQAKLDAAVRIIVATIGAQKQADPAVMPVADHTAVQGIQ